MMDHPKYPPTARHPRIAIDQDVMVGKPCIKGTRIPVHMILEQLSAGDTLDEILAGYPRLATDDVAAALAYAADALRPRRDHRVPASAQGVPAGRGVR
jgi:uncharacterized protein (DUF433 family)